MAEGPDRVPEPKLRKRRAPALTRVIASLLGLCVLVALVGGAVAFYAYQEFTLPGPLAGKKIYEIKKGISTPEIAASLEEQGIISDARIFSALSYLKGARSGSALKAGEYEFPANATMRDVMALIESGKAITYKVSIPEGWTVDATLTRLRENEVLTGEITSTPAEGSILPDTYVFKRGMTRQKLVEDMQLAQTKLLDDLWAKRNPALPFKTKEEAVTLASIVEKETAKADERPLIASVFLNRLAKNMRLQSDPTIIYGITGGKGKLDRALTRADITTPTPYNTYTIKGLPPGPIANPGREALAAVMNPQPTGNLYFVADGTGGHAFAETLEQHNKNVAEWRKHNEREATAAAMDDQQEQGQTETASPTASANVLPDINEPTTPGTTPIPQPDATANAGVEAAANAQSEAAAATPPAAETENAPVAAAEPPTKREDPKPGTVIKAGDKLIPIPRFRPKL